MTQLYVLFRYGALGVADVQYVKIRKSADGAKITWTPDKSKASGFKKTRAEAMQRGARGVGSQHDLVMEPK